MVQWFGLGTFMAAAAAKLLQLCPTVRPHRRQPTRLHHPWDSPGKNTVVGCHFLLQCMKGKSESEVAQLCPTLCYPVDCSPPGSSVRGIFQARVLEWGAIAFSFMAAAPCQGTKIPQKKRGEKIRNEQVPLSFSLRLRSYQPPLAAISVACLTLQGNRNGVRKAAFIPASLEATGVTERDESHSF